MNIWVIGRGYPSWGGINGSFELEQAKMLAKRGHKVIYLALVFHPYKKIKHWGYETWEEDGLNICVYSQIYMPVRMHFRMEGFQKKMENIIGKN